ncbi:MAG: SDR family NAD(P)-dependent oxidoreductase [Lachnospiraceae bacterium]
MFTLNGRTAIIIGSTGYEGLGAVRALVDGGMNVALSTLHGWDTAQELLQSEEKYHKHCIIVNHKDGDEANYRQAFEHFGSLDVIIPNHGDHFKYENFIDITQEQLFKELQHQNYTSLHMVQCAIPYLMKSKAGRIILMANVGARNGLPDEGLCPSTARAGVIAMTYLLARELAPDGITVNCIARGGMKGETNTDKLLAQMPLGRPGTDVEFGSAVAYLACEEAGFITGQVLNLCGGLYMG